MKIYICLFGFAFLLASVDGGVGRNGLGLRDQFYDNDEIMNDGPVIQCDNYNEKPNLSEGPCSAEDLDQNGFCNKTQICRPGSHCFMSWRNDSGVIKILNSGCWLKHHECVNRFECRASNDSHRNGVYYCCCEGSFCHRKFYLDPAADPAIEDTEPEVAESYNEWLILVYVLVPLIVVCAIVVFAFWVYRNKQIGLEALDGISVATPATADTRCTTVMYQHAMELPTPELLEVKARGRFGKVWRAQLHDSIVAVKTFDHNEKASWENEQEIFTTPLMTTHDNILKFLAASNRGGGLDSELWLITEFYEKGSLADYLKVHKVSLDEALRIVWSMAHGMSFLHEERITSKGEHKPAIAHRDFKSKNVLLDQNLNAVIADFGLAVKFTHGESPGEVHGQVGTLRYFSPEVLEGAISFQKDAFIRIDMYAFALVVWEIMTRCPFGSEDCGEFLLPFEEEFGNHLSMDQLQDWVCEKKLRPCVKDEWRRDKIMSTLSDTIEECWDHDAEARLSAGCVELRVKGLQRQRLILEPDVNETSEGSPLIMPSPTHVINNTETMNQLNIQRNNITSENNKNQQMNGQVGSRTTPPDDPTQSLNNHNEKGDAYVAQQLDDDHDSGTFANEDTLSHDGMMEQLIAENTDSVPQVQIVDGDGDSATSLLASDDQETDL
uniref:activin receptor type-2B-like n=1 Tax=Styela clava TaxID=7725 RepID=UPI00193A9E09|nr:activin receptor type-2B-like [Styela clava]